MRLIEMTQKQLLKITYSKHKTVAICGFCRDSTFNFDNRWLHYSSFADKPTTEDVNFENIARIVTNFHMRFFLEKANTHYSWRAINEQISKNTEYPSVCFV